MAENNDIEVIKAPDLPLQKFYDAELEEVPEKAKKLLQEYSKIPPDEVLPHVLEVVCIVHSISYLLINECAEKSSMEGGKTWAIPTTYTIKLYWALDSILSHVLVTIVS